MAISAQEPGKKSAESGKEALMQRKFADADASMKSALTRIPKITSISTIQKNELRRQILAARRYLSKKANSSLEMSQRLKRTMTLLEGLSATENVFQSNIKSASGQDKSELSSAFKLWKQRAINAADSLLRKTNGAQDAANMLVNMGMFVAGAGTEARDIRENLLPALKNIPMNTENRKACDPENVKNAPKMLSEAAKAVVDYWKKPTDSGFKNAAKLMTQYAKSDLAVQYSREEVILYQNYKFLIDSGRKAIKHINDRLILISKLEKAGRLNPYDAKNMRKQLKIVRKDMEWRLLSIQARLKKHKITDAAQKNGGLLLRNPNYYHDLPAMAMVFGRTPAFADKLSWRARLSQDVYAYLEAKGKRKGELGASLKKLIQECRMIIDSDIKALPAYVENPNGTEKKKIGPGTISSMRQVKGYLKATLNDLEQILFKGKIGDPERALKDISYEAMNADQAIASHIGSEMERHFDKRSWYQKHKLVVWDVAVIALSIASGGLATPLLLGAETLYFGTRATTNLLAIYAETGKRPGFFDFLGNGALALLPPARLGRAVVASRIAGRGVLSAEFAFSLRAGSEIARRVGVEMAASTSRTAVAFGRIANVSGMYLMGSATVGLALNPTMENFLTNLVFFGAGFAGARAGKMAGRTVAQYSATRMNEVHAALMSASERSAQRTATTRRVLRIAGGTLRGAGRGMQRAVRATTLRAGITDIIDSVIKGGKAGFKQARQDAQLLYEGGVPAWNKTWDSTLTRDATAIAIDAEVLFAGFMKFRSDGGTATYPEFVQAIQGNKHINQSQAKRANASLKWAEGELAPKPAPVPKEAPAPKAPAIDEAAVNKKLAKAASDLGVTIEEMFRDLEPKDVREHLSQQGLPKAEIDFALSKHAKEIIEGFESNIKGKKDADLIIAIETDGKQGGQKNLENNGYPKEIAASIIETEYSLIIQKYVKSQKSLAPLFSGYSQAMRDHIFLHKDVMKAIKQRPELVRETLDKLPDVYAKLRLLIEQSKVTNKEWAAKELADLVPGVYHKMERVYGIELSSGQRAVFFENNGKIYVIYIGPHTPYEALLDKIRPLRKKPGAFDSKLQNYQGKSSSVKEHLE